MNESYFVEFFSTGIGEQGPLRVLIGPIEKSNLNQQIENYKTPRTYQIKVHLAALVETPTNLK